MAAGQDEPLILLNDQSETTLVPVERPWFLTDDQRPWLKDIKIIHDIHGSQLNVQTFCHRSPCLIV